MRLRALLEGVELKGPLPRDMEISGISYDTRTIKPGELFVALRGSKTDGHRYISEARQKGAAAVLAGEGEDTLLTGDSRRALALLSANWFGRPAQKLTVIGVTGTNGKTTTATLLRGMVERALETKVGLIGTNGVVIGEQSYPAQRTTPESYEVQQWLSRMVGEGCTHVVMEVSSHALCLCRVEGIPFSVGAFTNLTRDHLDFHKTMEAYREAKGRLFAQSKTAVLNWDDPAGQFYKETVTCPVLTYSPRGEGGDLRAKDIRLYPGRTAFTLVSGREEHPVEVGIPGSFTVCNALCALSCGAALGIPLAVCVPALKGAPGVRGRMETVPTPAPGRVVIDYAHTPDALEKALLALGRATSGRLICLFGCGGDRDRTKRPIMGKIASCLADVCIITSDNPRSEEPEDIIDEILAGTAGCETPVMTEPNRRAAIHMALELLREGDTLLLAGKGHEDYQEVKGEKLPFDEREIVAKFYDM